MEHHTYIFIVRIISQELPERKFSPKKGNFPSRYYFHSGASRDICRVVKEETIRPGRVLKVEGDTKEEGGGREMNEPRPT